MRYLFERRNAKPGKLGIVLFITRGPWWRVHIPFKPARSVYGWFWSMTIGNLRLNLERRTPMGFAAEDVAADIVRSALSKSQ